MPRRGRVERIANTRLGLQLTGQRTGMGETAAVGWCLYRLERPEPTGRVDRGDPLSMARAALRAQPGAPLFVYGSDEAFEGTRGQIDGLNRLEHKLMVERIAAQLADEGFVVQIQIIS